MVAALAMVPGLTSCELDEYNPTGGSATIDNYETWKGLQTQCYSTLYNELYSKEDFYFVSECGTDLWLNHGADYAPQIFYYDALGVSYTQPRKTWQQAYSVIATCNTVINETPAADGSQSDDIKVLKAEAKTLRAFMHLTLATYFGPIPICTAEVGETDNAPVRNSLQEVYNSITTDLKEAANDLDVQPYEGNYARVTKKTALGLLARAYAQGAAEGLTEDGKSYWERAKEVSEDMIRNAATYGMYLYPDVSDLWAQENNRNNAEALFTASGLDATGADAGMAGTYANFTCTLGGFTLCDPNSLSRMYNNIQMGQNQYLGVYGTTSRMAPTKYAIDVFGDWDKRYENSFLTAFGTYTMPTGGAYSYSRQQLSLSSTICTGIGIDPSFAGQRIYPYVALETATRPGGEQTYATGIYAKGGTEQVVPTKNALVVDMPLAQDEDRIRIYLSKKDLTDAEKQQYRCFTINISELFDADGNYKTGRYTDRGTTAYTANAYSLYPSLIKFDFLYDGATRQLSSDNRPYRNGDVFIMRAAEIYLIAAEANVMLGNNGAAAQYLKPLRDRAARTGTAPALNNPTEQDILDEYAREFVGEHMRWAVLKRHRASGLMKQALQKNNKRAASNFNESIHYWRPIPQRFLDQIQNKEEFGDNGYGYTANSGL